ncbi:MAG: class I SAM-dependent methyltransferase [Bacteroidota bacterium]
MNIGKKLIFLVKRFGWYKRLNAKVIYEILAKRVPAADWHFMNYGYVQSADEKPLELPNDPHLQRYPLQMYHYLASKINLEGKQVLEVGSGRGGGARYISQALKPAFYTGMDLAQNAVDLANKLHQFPNLKFIQGSAENIPLPDKSMDVVINVESCHAYGSVPKFLSEVKRVLKPGGHLLLVDFRKTEVLETFRDQLRDSKMQWLSEEDITENVVQAIESEDESKQARIKALIPPKWQKLFAEFAGVVGSPLHLNLKNRARLYYRYVIRKETA